MKAVDFEGYTLEMKQYRNEDAEITLFNSLGDRVDLETAKIVIRRMDLSIRAEDIKNLISDKDLKNTKEDSENPTNEISENDNSFDNEDSLEDYTEEDSDTVDNNSISE